MTDEQEKRWQERARVEASKRRYLPGVGLWLSVGDALRLMREAFREGGDARAEEIAEMMDAENEATISEQCAAIYRRCARLARSTITPEPSKPASPALDIVLSRGPGPHSDFVEAEVDGRGVRCGEWVDRDDGLVALRITRKSFERAITPREPDTREAVLLRAAQSVVDAYEKHRQVVDARRPDKHDCYLCRLGHEAQRALDWRPS